MQRIASSQPPARKGYHHGALKDALVQVAEQLLAEKGPAGFTLADAARAAGVTPAAPYRHFTDREALLTEVARRGFAAFAARLNAALTAAKNPADGMVAMGKAYLSFARENPGAYTAMFAGPLSEDRSGLAGTGEEAFGVLVRGMERALKERLPAGTDTVALACQIWALSHGVATLTASGRLCGFLGGSPEAILMQGVNALVLGTLAEKPH